MMPNGPTMASPVGYPMMPNGPTMGDPSAMPNGPMANPPDVSTMPNGPMTPNGPTVSNYSLMPGRFNTMRTSHNSNYFTRNQIDSQVMRSLVFQSDLNGENEVPPNSSTATGVMLALLSRDMSRLDYVLHTNGLDDIIAAHFHDGASGTNGPIVKTIDINTTTGRAIGSWTSGDNDEPLTPDLVEQLIAGDIYINVHTSTYPDGEIRDQLFLISRGSDGAY